MLFSVPGDAAVLGPVLRIAGQENPEGGRILPGCWIADGRKCPAADPGADAPSLHPKGPRLPAVPVSARRFVKWLRPADPLAFRLPGGGLPWHDSCSYSGSMVERCPTSTPVEQPRGGRKRPPRVRLKKGSLWLHSTKGSWGVRSGNGILEAHSRFARRKVH